LSSPLAELLALGGVDWLDVAPMPFSPAPLLSPNRGTKWRLVAGRGPNESRVKWDFVVSPHFRGRFEGILLDFALGIVIKVRFPSPAPLIIKDLRSCAVKV